MNPVRDSGRFSENTNAREEVRPRPVSNGMNVLGVKVYGHDTGAALISGTRLVAIAEERLSRVKHSPGMFPARSIAYCLEHLGLAPGDIDMVLMDQTGLGTHVRLKEIFEKETGGTFARAAVHVVNHHDAHAASAFFCSPFEESAVLVYDGTGEKFATHLGVHATETDTLYAGGQNELHEIHKNVHAREGRFFPSTFGIGKLYSFFTDYVNLGALNEGKLMGLAPYGTPALLKTHPYEAWCRLLHGTVLCNSRITYPGMPRPQGLRRRVREIVRAVFRFVDHRLSEEGACPAPFPEIRLERPRRTNEALPDAYYSSVAYAAQKIFEYVAILLGRQLKKITRLSNLSVAGGCGLNIDANMNFLEKVGFERLFVQPASSDTGIPLGLALYGCHVVNGQPRFYEMTSASLGRPYTDEETVAALKEKEGELSFSRPPDIAEEAARLIADGNIVGWFYGGSEYGPRALGHRSILADARKPDMRDVLNMKVKHREPWRPFAASVLRERVGDFFAFEGDSPFMLIAASVHEDKRELIPSVTHVDGTCRIQTVTKESNGQYYDLINAFYQRTGTPLILNTSFNLGGEPIVETPADAIRTFLATQIDYLVLDRYLVTKRSASPDTPPAG